MEKQNKKEAKDQTEKAFVMKCRRGTRSKLRLDADVGQRRPARLSRRHSETDIVSRRSARIRDAASTFADAALGDR